MTRRKIAVGQGYRFTERTTEELAQTRADLCETYQEAGRFMTVYHQVRSDLQVRLASGHVFDTDLLLGRLARKGPVEEAAVIEALASLRAEGAPL